MHPENAQEALAFAVADRKHLQSELYRVMEALGTAAKREAWWAQRVLSEQTKEARA